MGLVAGEVGPLVRVGPEVVEFLGAVVVADVAVVFGADGVVVRAEGGEGGAWPVGGGVPEEWHEAGSVEVVAFRESAEVDEGGVDAEQFGGPPAGVPALMPGAAMMKGTLVARSQRACLAQRSFSPRKKPWSE